MLRNKIPSSLKQVKNLATNSSIDLINPTFTNRNPRNLERLYIGYKPNGYHLEKPGHIYWHKLVLNSTSRHVTASIIHYENGEVINVSTKEWALQKQLYRTSDTSAYINLGRVLAQRCLECGISEVTSNIEANPPDGKVGMFLQTLQKNGLSLQEGEQYRKPRPWDQNIKKLI